MIPHSVFVWTFSDVAGLVILAVLLLFFACAFGYCWIEKKIKQWRKRP